MIFRETELPGVWVIDPEPSADERGFFARTWCAREFEARGLTAELAQCSLSWNRARGTVRGLHFQAAPHEEAKLVRCTRGTIHDVALDLRPGSPTRHRWTAVELSADNRRMLFVPEGVAHGFQTLVDDTEVFYQISRFHQPDAQRGVRWHDPALGITWPVRDAIVSARDAALPLLADL
jgi:dTDP-4-dehydrorhamnose 3,5-epimerase